MGKKVKYMENDKRPKLEQILGKQAIAVLNEAGISNLRVEKDGSISGEHQVVGGLPQSDQIKKISLKIESGRIVIRGRISGSTTDSGKII